MFNPFHTSDEYIRGAVNYFCTYAFLDCHTERINNVNIKIQIHIRPNIKIVTNRISFFGFMNFETDFFHNSANISRELNILKNHNTAKIHYM